MTRPNIACTHCEWESFEEKSIFKCPLCGRTDCLIDKETMNQVEIIDLDRDEERDRMLEKEEADKQNDHRTPYDSPFSQN